MEPQDTVLKLGFSVTVGIDHLFRSVFLRHPGKDALLFQDIGGRIVEEHQELPVSGFPGFPEGILQTDGFPADQFLSVFFRLLVPAEHFSGKPVDQERSLKGESFGPHQGIVPIGCEIVLEEEQFPGILLVQGIGFLGFPEHVMVPPDQDLPSRQIGNEVQVLPALVQLPSPGMIPYQHQGIPWLHQFLAVLPDFFLVADPDGPHGIHGFLRPLKGQMEISQGIKCHLIHLLFPYCTLFVRRVPDG